MLGGERGGGVWFPDVFAIRLKSLNGKEWQERRNFFVAKLQYFCPASTPLWAHLVNPRFKITACGIPASFSLASTFFLPFPLFCIVLVMF